MKRQAATTKGAQRRLRDAEFERVHEPRQAPKVIHPLRVVRCALVAAMTTRARSLRRVEERTGQIVAKHGSWIGIKRRIADNTFGKILPRLEPVQVCAALHRQVKAEHRRGNLTANRPDKATSDKVKDLLKKDFPHVQLCCPKDGLPYGLVRVHNVTLISSAAAPCIHQRTIPGHTNENGAMPDLIDDVLRIYGRSKLIEMFTTPMPKTRRSAQPTSSKAASSPTMPLSTTSKALAGWIGPTPAKSSACSASSRTPRPARSPLATATTYRARAPRSCLP